MAVTGPFAELSHAREELERAAKGDTVRTIGAALRSTAFGLAARGWDAREAPRGTPWRPAKGGFGGGLSLTGRLRAALLVETRARGFALTDRAQAANGQFYGGTHQYGRTIRAKGLKPMRWRTPDGHWHSATKVRVPARPILPRSGELPSRWAEAFETAIAGEVSATFFSG
jgi:phage gpG-like protein